MPPETTSHHRVRKAGRRPKLSPEQQAAIVDAVRSGQRSAAQMARHHKISEATVSRILAAARAVAAAPGAEDVDGERIVGGLPPAPARPMRRRG
jgi:transposase-like protein